MTTSPPRTSLIETSVSGTVRSSTKRSRSAYRRQVVTPRSREAGTPAVGPEARRRAALILEVLAGLRTPVSAAEALQIGAPRYYLLEQCALQGLVSACEPRPKGRTLTPERQITKLERELTVCRRELSRQQALARAAQRALGVPGSGGPPAKGSGPPVPGTKGRRQRKPAVRALRAARVLRGDSSGTEGLSAIKAQPEQPVAGGDRVAEKETASPIMPGAQGGFTP
jgi:hypothetical protein